ncbi:hypothetical protein B0H15DRAFT_937128 [Mycena belliarum]|uniref:SET domain-containing protein n=1 Tax=Mycena belliarum TaxID=1033014 RepID=A0AAD6UJE0_9AGAR|nr:hypothetical protein B0H15DRAFT_937128 [Mycena belliae]
MSSRTSTLLTITGISLCGLIAYAVYFDYRRRNDAAFRKDIRKQKKRVDKSLAQSREALAAANTVSEADLREALKLIRSEPPLSSQEAKENYFMSQVAMGEQLAARGESFQLPAALSFYRALLVYPSAPELLAIYEKTVPPPIVKIVLDLVNLDASTTSVTYRQPGAAHPPRPPRRNGTGSLTQARKLPLLPDHVEQGEKRCHVATIYIHLLVIYLYWPRITTVLAYYNAFPPKRTNVSVQPRALTSDASGPQRVLILNKDVAAGEVIYKEYPMLTCLDYDLQSAGTHCAHCLRKIEPALGSIPLTSSDSIKTIFCSKPCQLASKTQWHSFLFTLDPPLPAVLELAQLTPSPAALDARRAAQVRLSTYLNKDKKVGAALVAKFIARQLTASLGKAPGTPDYTEADGGEYRIEDYVERWSMGTVNAPPEEYSLFVSLLQTTLPGLEAFIGEEIHKMLLQKLTFNAFGVCFGGGRDNRPPSTVRPEDVELTRTPYGTERQIGTALYSVSAYLSHSCAPNARPSFASGTSELHLIANKDLKKGDELTIAYVDVAQHAEENAASCRLRRRKELARGWKFACQCSRCVKEGSENVPPPAMHPQDLHDYCSFPLSLPPFQEMRNLKDDPCQSLAARTGLCHSERQID